jgi:hypothetical protein
LTNVHEPQIVLQLPNENPPLLALPSDDGTEQQPKRPPIRLRVELQELIGCGAATVMNGSPQSHSHMPDSQRD